MNPSIADQPSRSLSWTLTKSSLIAVAIGMATYTLFEILTSGEVDTREIITHHLLPTVLIGAIIWAVLTMLLRSKVITPVRDILDHLTHVGNGRFAPLEKSNEITEIRAIITGVNLLTSKLKNAPDNEGSSKAVDDLIKLRADLKEVIDSETITHDQLVPIMKDLKQLEGHLLSALQAESTHNP
ncbi:hypothetical protein N9A94_01095 [Akkermansiaceae bacterium]|nr:hypothetical protein [Akkermansiaceae bacterium]